MTGKQLDDACYREALRELSKALDATTSHEEWMQTIDAGIRTARAWKRANREVCGVFLWRYRLDQLLTWAKARVDEFNAYIERRKPIK